jgi:hypothetical protein
MNTEKSEISPAARSTFPSSDEMTRLKRELLQAEIKLAKARATATGAEMDLKMLNGRIRDIMK